MGQMHLFIFWFRKISPAFLILIEQYTKIILVQPKDNLRSTITFKILFSDVLLMHIHFGELGWREDMKEWKRRTPAATCSPGTTVCEKIRNKKWRIPQVLLLRFSTDNS